MITAFSFIFVGIELPVRLAVHTPEPKLSINQLTRTVDRRTKKGFYPNTAPSKVFKLFMNVILCMKNMDLSFLTSQNCFT